MTTCLLTGGAGFVGSHVARALQEFGYKIVIVSRTENIDFTHTKDLEKFFYSHHFDYVFHLAAEGTLHNHAETNNLIETNIVGTYNLFRLAAKYQVKGFINTGSSSEYGICNALVREDMALTPTFTFAATKAATTMLAIAVANELDLPIVTVRPFALYGPQDHSHRFVPTVIRAALEGEVLPLHPGSHDWIYVKDLAYAMIQLVKKAGTLKGKIFNVGTGITTDNKSIVHIVEGLVGKKIRTNIKTNEFHQYDKNSWIADCSLLQSVIPWKPTPLVDGLMETVRWYQEEKMV